MAIPSSRGNKTVKDPGFSDPKEFRIRATYFDGKVADGTPARFCFADQHLVISTPEGSEIQRWPIRRVRMLSGPEYGEPLRLGLETGDPVSLMPQSSVNISWLARECPNLLRPQRTGGAAAARLPREISTAIEFPDFASRWKMMPFRRHLLFACYMTIAGLFAFALWIFSLSPGELMTENETAAPGPLSGFFGSSNVSGMAPTELCGEAVMRRQGAAAWNKLPEAQEYVTEAQARGFTLADCLEFLTENNRESFRGLSDPVICAMALRDKVAPPVWDMTVRGSWYVREAKERNMTPTKCAEIVKASEMRVPAPATDPAKASIARMTNKDICFGVKYGHPEYMVQAKRRNLGSEDCREPLRENAAVMSREKLRPQFEDLAELNGVDVASLCSKAFISRLPRPDGSDDWEENARTEIYIAEAQRRGLDVFECAEIARVSYTGNTYPAFVGEPDLVVCDRAVRSENGHDWWQTERRFFSSIIEARRRGLSLADCSKVLGR